MQNEFKINDCKTFDELMNLFYTLKPKGFGPLTKYDVASRIGAYKSLKIERIYLHAGTKEGAAFLGNNCKGNSILKSDLPEPFCSCELSCADLENLLCICKKLFNSIMPKTEFELCCQNVFKEACCFFKY